MQLTRFSDYGLRVLLYLGLKDSLSSIAEVSRVFRLPENHLAVVVHRLSRLGYVSAIRGRAGGIKLAVDPSNINIGAVVEQLEPNFKIAECLDRTTNTCHLLSSCQIREYFAKATQAFLNVLKKHSLADVLANRLTLQRKMARRKSHNTQKGAHHGGGKR
jgi:Rrf2 family nitric oxide-sensitive transcriptional repressor